MFYDIRYYKTGSNGRTYASRPSLGFGGFFPGVMVKITPFSEYCNERLSAFVDADLGAVVRQLMRAVTEVRFRQAGRRLDNTVFQLSGPEAPKWSDDGYSVWLIMDATVELVQPKVDTWGEYMIISLEAHPPSDPLETEVKLERIERVLYAVATDLAGKNSSNPHVKVEMYCRHRLAINALVHWWKKVKSQFHELQWHDQQENLPVTLKEHPHIIPVAGNLPGDKLLDQLGGEGATHNRAEQGDNVSNSFFTGWGSSKRRHGRRRGGPFTEREQRDYVQLYLRELERGNVTNQSEFCRRNPIRRKITATGEISEKDEVDPEEIELSISDKTLRTWILKYERGDYARLDRDKERP